ncbi:caspase family protein [Streptomyces sp. NPDC046909]|uniref:caspase family protein n=1 Tax=Streptomyces sp. NPDC046909 TaxID=3155617 RepID=UPI0033C186EC
MGTYKALLVGASDYEMHGIQSLPFIPGDLARLSAVLRTHGFQSVDVYSRADTGRHITANFINARVAGFLRRASPGDTLLILLSGHGVHARGTDYLVPEDIDEDTHPFESGCVAIDWRHLLDETPAAHVVILIDACREGIDQDSMGVSSVKGWGRQKVRAALRRKVAYVYACSPAQLSLFVQGHEQVQDRLDHGTVPGESFSLFSRSVSDVVASLPQGFPLSLLDFKDRTEKRVTELHRAYGKRGEPQSIRVVTDIAQHDFYFLPPPPLPQGNGLLPGETLRAGRSVSSANGAFTFTYQADGNLVLYRESDGLPLWSAATGDRPVGVCILNGDGSLVVYDAAGHEIWASGTLGNPGSRLVIEDDGNAVIRGSDGTPLWTTDTAGPPDGSSSAWASPRQMPIPQLPDRAATMSGPGDRSDTTLHAEPATAPDDWFSRLYGPDGQGGPYSEADQTDPPVPSAPLEPQPGPVQREPRPPGRIRKLLTVWRSRRKTAAERRAALRAQQAPAAPVWSGFWLPNSPVRTLIACVFMPGVTLPALGIATTGFTAGLTHRNGPPVYGLVFYAVIVSMALFILWVFALAACVPLVEYGSDQVMQHPRQDVSGAIAGLVVFSYIPGTLYTLITGLVEPRWLGPINTLGYEFAHAVGLF